MQHKSKVQVFNLKKKNQVLQIQAASLKQYGRLLRDEMDAPAPDTATIAALIARKAVLEETDGVVYHTPLMAAVAGGHREIARLLIHAGAQINSQRAIARQTPLLKAAAMGNTDMLRLLLSHDADPHLGNVNQLTPLHMAAINGSAEMVQLLLDYGANPLAQDIQGMTPLDVARKMSNPQTCEMLAEAMRQYKQSEGLQSVTLQRKISVPRVRLKQKPGA